MKVDVLTPSGFCGGVINVLKLINYVVENHSDQPIYCIGQVVHNNDVNQDILSKGVKVLVGDKEKLVDQIDSGVVVFSAHGTNDDIVKKARNKGLIVYNAICPFVDKSFDAIKQKRHEGYKIIYIGKKGHDEAVAALSLDSNIYLVEKVEDVDKLNLENEKIAVINQTTLSLLDIKNIYSAIKEKYKDCLILDEICNTTRIRQTSLIAKAKDYDLVLVVGDKTSSNSLSLYNISKKLNDNTKMVLNEKEVDLCWFNDVKSVLIASGASTPNAVIEEIIKKIKSN